MSLYKGFSYYPKSCFSIREDVTRAAKAEYDRKKDLIYKRCEELCAEDNRNFWEMPFRERMELKKKVEEELGL